MEEGLTLIEILIVIAIISFLLSICLPAFQKARVKGLIVRTKMIISSIESALSMYESDFGDYPHSKNTSKILVELLQGPCDSPRWNGPYIKFKKDDIDKDGNIVDAWKNPIIYRYPQSAYKNIQYLIVSAGPDRKFGTSDDIGNW